MKMSVVFCSLITAVTLLSISCAPGAAPVAAPVPQPAQATTAAPVTAVPSTKPEDVAWQKVVEAARKEGTVTVYSFWWVGDQSTSIARAFRQRHGIDVQIITGRGAEFLERLKVEKRIGKVTADVFEGSATHSQNAKDAGILASVADLPALQDKAGWSIQPLVFDPTAHILLHRPWAMVPFVNTKLVKPEDVPKTWNDLLLPKWRGKMVVPDPNVSNSAYYLLLLVRHGDVGGDFVRQLAQQELRFVKDSGDAVRDLARGDAALLPNATDSSAAPFAQEGAPIRAVEVEKGTIASGGVITWVKDSPHPNAARVFINWVLSDEGQKIEAEAGGTLPMRQAVTDFRHPAIRARINQPLVIGVQENEDIAKAFRDKVLVDTLMKGR